MSRRERLETAISDVQDMLKKAPEDTPKEMREIWEKQLDDLEVELNNLVDTDDNNE